MAYDVPSDNHFEGGANLTKGSRKSDGDATLAEYIRSINAALNRIKTGRVTAAGAGDEVVTFAVAFADTSYSIALSPGSVSGGTVKDGTETAAGFTIVAGGAGVIGWTATHDE